MHLSVKKIVIAASWILLGVALTLFGIYGLLMNFGKPSPSSEKHRKEWVMEYSSKEQEKLGVNCRDINQIVDKSVRANFAAVLARRVQGASWNHLVPSEAKEEIERTSWIIRRCAMLFHDGENGKLNGLDAIGFIDELYVEYSKFKVTLMFGPPSYCDTDACRDRSFDGLKKNYEKLLKR